MSAPASRATAPAAAERRLRELFRHSLRDHDLHPLLHLLRTHRGCEAAAIETAIETVSAAATATSTRVPCRSAAAAPGATAVVAGAAVPSAQQLVAGIRDLPALPAAANQLLATLDDDDVGPTRLAAIVSQDPALTAKTLRLANSSFYGLSRQVATVTEATTILGVDTVRSVALAAALAAGVAPPRCAGFDFAAFWRHAIGTALCARALARLQSLDTGRAFLLGLLHDIGKLALASRFAQPYAAVLRQTRQHDGEPAATEQALLGTDHAAIGAHVASHWRFEPALAEAIADHHALPADGSGGRLLDVVHVADHIAHALDLAQQADDAVPPLELAAWIRLGLDESRCLPLFAAVESEHAALSAALLG